MMVFAFDARSLVMYFFICLPRVMFGQSGDSNDSFGEQLVLDSVKSWILENALYSNTYRSIEFSDFDVITHYEGDVELFKQYQIYHKHMLKNVHGNISQFEGAFLFNEELMLINIFSVQTDSIRTSYKVSIYDQWCRDFRRLLSCDEIVAENEIRHKKLLKTLRDSQKDFDEPGVDSHTEKLIYNLLHKGCDE